MNISTLISNFMRQNIQSEQEVRSKLIVPLLELLEYPVDLRAEEFPVYGSEGSKDLRAKAVDFIQFASNEFDRYRGNTERELEWVYTNSLLVFEAKKPTEKILVKGQPVFYSAWTKAVAYMICNGITIEGYIVNANYSDTCVFSCSVKDIPEKWEQINSLNYHRILEMKTLAAANAEWTQNDDYQIYKNVMLVRCQEELYASIDRDLEGFSYGLNIEKNGKNINITEILDEECKIITSEPGGGKTYLMWMLMREYLIKYSEMSERLPIFLEGRYFGKVYTSIVDGIYREMNVLLPFVTREMIEKRLRDGGFVLLFDALDEVEKEYEVLVYELHQLRRDTNNIIIVTSRMHNYKGTFVADFEHYMIGSLSDEKIHELIKKYSDGKFDIYAHSIPKQLLEVIRTPLFLKMFVSVSDHGEMYKVVANRAMLFDVYIEEKCKQLFCSVYEKTLIKSVLGQYAYYTYEYGDDTKKFFDILDKTCDSSMKENLTELVWKTGIMAEGMQGLKFFHKAMQEFLVALHLSNYDEDELMEWFEKNVQTGKYDEIICYLVGVITKQRIQNSILDYLEKHTLKLYVRALKARKKFEISEEELGVEYVQKYFEQLLNTYDTIVKTYFYNVRSIFDGYDVRSEFKVCLRGGMYIEEKSILLVIYSGLHDTKQLEVELLKKDDMTHFLVGEKKLTMSCVDYKKGHVTYREYNLGKLLYGVDSAREIAVDIIKKQLIKEVKKKYIFDIEVDVLLAERVETELKRIRGKIKDKSISEQLSLYTGDISSIIKNIDLTVGIGEELNAIKTFCEILSMRVDDVKKYLDVRPDIVLEKGRYIYQYDELYTDEQLVKKVSNVLMLSQEATRQIVTRIISVLAEFWPNRRVVGVVYRNEIDSGVEYIWVRSDEGEADIPIIEFSEDRIDMFPDLDIYYLDKMKMIGKTENDFCGGESSVLTLYFGKDVFHNRIYQRIESMLKKLFDDRG